MAKQNLKDLIKDLRFTTKGKSASLSVTINEKFDLGDKEGLARFEEFRKELLKEGIEIPAEPGDNMTLHFGKF